MAELIQLNQVGAREDLADLIAIADQKATPLVSAARKSTAPTNPLFSWLVDGYAPVSRSGVRENEDATTFVDPAAQRARLYGRVQKLWTNPKVSDVAENVSDVAGIGTKREMARAIKKSLVEIARNCEATFCSDTDSREETSAQPRLTRGLGAWVSNSAQSDSATAVPADYRTPAASISTASMANTTESVVQGLMQSIYQRTGKAKTFTMLCGPSLKRTFSNMTQVQFGTSNPAAVVRTFNADLSENKLEYKVDVFSGDFGELLLVPSLYLRTDVSEAASLNSGFILDMDGIHLRYNRRPRYMPIPDLGGGPRGIVDTIAALQVDNPLTHGKIASAS